MLSKLIQLSCVVGIAVLVNLSELLFWQKMMIFALTFGAACAPYWSKKD